MRDEDLGRPEPVHDVGYLLRGFLNVTTELAVLEIQEEYVLVGHAEQAARGQGLGGAKSFHFVARHQIRV